MTDLLPLLWVDLETGGLDHGDPVLEVAAILTTSAMEEISATSWVVNPTLEPAYRVHPRWWERDLDPVVRDMHTRNGLLDAVACGLPLGNVELALGRKMDETGYTGPWRLAGSGVAAFDLHVLRRQLPTVAARLHYAPLDVGQVRRFLEYAARGALVPSALTLEGNPDSPDLHRAMGDLRLHLAEGRHYLHHFVFSDLGY